MKKLPKPLRKPKSPPATDSDQKPDGGKRIEGTLSMDCFWRAIDARSR